jgi:hypothetical protein
MRINKNGEEEQLYLFSMKKINPRKDPLILKTPCPTKF